jgi:hypothetical protein
MAMARLARDSMALATDLIDRCFHGQAAQDSIEKFLSESIDLKYQRALERKVDNHPLAVRDG